MKNGNRKIFSFDAETNGLLGAVFAIGAVVVDVNGQVAASFIGRCPIVGSIDSWVNDNILPAVVDIEESYANYYDLLASFASFYTANKTEVDYVVHMGNIVEAHILREMVEKKLIQEEDLPYALIDISGNLYQVGEVSTSVDLYIEKYNLIVYGLMVKPHNPLYDAAATAAVFHHLQNR